MSTESVILTSTINAHEGHNVGICDILGAFLSADMDKEVKMALRGRYEELTVKIESQIYIQHVIYEKVSPVLYITLKKDIYGCLISALLFYERPVADMRGKGDELNPYDPCVANKTVGGKQMKVFWHVDNLKVSHVEPK